jgi:hypothetical protein
MFFQGDSARLHLPEDLPVVHFEFTQGNLAFLSIPVLYVELKQPGAAS